MGQATELVVDWARGTPRGSDHETYLARRLMVADLRPAHEDAQSSHRSSTRRRLPDRNYRIAPYLYPPAEIDALIEAASKLTQPLWAATWTTLIGLLAVTGMRTREACRLDRDRVDLDAKSLVIEDSKFGKSRRLFLHPSTVARWRDYEHRRDNVVSHTGDGEFLRVHARNPSGTSNINHIFAKLVDAAGIATPAGRRRAHRRRTAPPHRPLQGRVHRNVRNAAQRHRDCRTPKKLQQANQTR